LLAGVAEGAEVVDSPAKPPMPVSARRLLAAYAPRIGSMSLSGFPNADEVEISPSALCVPNADVVLEDRDGCEPGLRDPEVIERNAETSTTARMVPPTSAKQPPKTPANALLDACLSKITLSDPNPIALKIPPLMRPTVEPPAMNPPMMLPKIPSIRKPIHQPVPDGQYGTGP
jgi:hypothetical protein